MKAKLRFNHSFFCLLLYLVLGISTELAAQSDGTMPLVLYPDPVSEQVSKRMPRTFKSQAEAEKILSEETLILQKKGYLEAGVDSLIERGKILHAYLHLGPRYLLGAISFDGLDQVYINRYRLDRMAKKGKIADWETLENRMQAVLREFENGGYPFASFDSLQIDYQGDHSDSLFARLKYQFDPGPFIKIDSILIEGQYREKDEFIYSLIRLAPGEAYQQKLMKDIPRILNNTIYYQKVRPAKVQFTPYNSVKLRIKVEQQRANRFDLLLGVLSPDQPDQRLRVTGVADLQFVSPFRTGEVIQFRYNQLQQGISQLQFNYRQPKIGGLPVTATFGFELFRQDTFFLNRNLSIGAIYPFSPFLSASFTYKTRNTSLLSSAPFEQDSLSVPDALGGNSQLYTVGFRYETLDDRIAPRSGILGNLEIGRGQRTVKNDARVAEQVFDALGESQPVTEITFQGDYFYPLADRHIWHVQQRTYWLEQETYFQNDQLQTGGGRSIRGFNENQFFTNFMALFTFEHRLMLERHSYMMAFVDWAYLENQVENTVTRPLGLGIGMQYETKAGIISVIYGMGRTDEQPFQPTRGKLHLGFVNQF
ncbi:MAG: BamA/TamA family outer membrane protein [Bacteroidota bacterium]